MAVNGDGVHAAQRGGDGERVQAAARPGAYALDDAWIYKIAVLADLVASRVLKAVQSVSSLNLSQWRVLAALADKPGRTASEVVAITPMDKAIVSRAAASLVDQGLVERRASATDGRVSHLHLTADGERTHRVILNRIDEDHAGGRGLLGREEEADFLAALDRVIAAYRGARLLP